MVAKSHENYTILIPQLWTTQPYNLHGGMPQNISQAPRC